MEGGSRQGRASSRYGSGPTAPRVFNGPVRKWKKQWVLTSSSSSSPQLNDTANKRNDTSPPLLLCRWTPILSAHEPRKRRFRYAPVVVEMEKGSGETVEKVNNEAKASNKIQSQGTGNGTDGIFEKANDTTDSAGEEIQELGEEELESNGGRRMVIKWED